MACLDDNAIVALLEPELPEAERAVFTAHLDACGVCRALVADAARADDGPRFRAPGTTIGRYVVLETIGAGAMGIVYAAYDPELRRKIALKLLRPEADGGADGTAGRERLMREAHVIARLQHPHVIAIHDVGVLDGEVFLAMELVEGGTLRDWLGTRGERREWREVVVQMRQVGEGLIAAHAAGLVHRDLKPDNILVGSDGRVRVTDFGLAADDEAVMVPGIALGTPAYMAPEQLRGAAADAATDQFSFCVTLHEALYGERPFAGTSAGPIRTPSPSATRRVPAWLRKVVARGLAAEPAARFPSMTELVAALAPRAGVTQRRALVAGIAVAAIAGAVVALAAAKVRSGDEVCGGADEAWHGVWEPEQRAALRAAFARTGRGTAATASASVEHILDDEAAAWRSMHAQVCRATRVRGDASEAQLDARMACLGDRRREVGALVAVLSRADGELVDRAVSAALALPSLADCENVHALGATPAIAESAVDAVRDERIAGELATASALEYAGAYVQGMPIAQAALGEARTARRVDLIAKLELVLGRLHAGAHDFTHAEADLEESAAAAEEAGDDAVAADAWTALIRVVGFYRSRPDDARVWSRLAESAIHRLGGDDEREALRLRLLATVAWRREEKLDEARTLIGQARALFERSHGARYEFEVASCDEGLAGIEFDSARPEAALALHERAGAVRERLFGANHPSVAVSLVNRGEDLTKLGRAREAIPLIERAIAIAAPTVARGGDAYYEHRLAAALRGAGDPAGALVHDQRALAAHVRAGEAGTYWEAWALTGEGLDLLALDRAGEALAPLERAVVERADHSTRPEIAESKLALAQALRATGSDPRARQLAREALAALSPDADRFGGWYGAMRDDIQHFLAP